MCLTNLEAHRFGEAGWTVSSRDLLPVSASKIGIIASSDFSYVFLESYLRSLCYRVALCACVVSPASELIFTLFWLFSGASDCMQGPHPC